MTLVLSYLHLRIQRSTWLVLVDMRALHWSFPPVVSQHRHCALVLCSSVAANVVWLWAGQNQEGFLETIQLLLDVGTNHFPGYEVSSLSYCLCFILLNYFI